jgi:hypothetical protein
MKREKPPFATGDAARREEFSCDGFGQQEVSAVWNEGVTIQEGQ